MTLRFEVNGCSLTARDFVALAEAVWPGKYDLDATEEALRHTINIAAWDESRLVGCVRVLTDGVYFGTVTEILVLPEYQRKGIGRELMRLVSQHTPTRLYFGAQPQAEGFYEAIGCKRGMTSFVIEKAREDWS